jgi:hypothetical protein
MLDSVLNRHVTPERLVDTMNDKIVACLESIDPRYSPIGIHIIHELAGGVHSDVFAHV